MQKLNFPAYNFRFKSRENKTLIFDDVRKKFVVLGPEEWVRQHCIKYLMTELKIPHSLINAEKELKINNLRKRYDIVVFRPNGDIFLIVECKAPNIQISQQTFNQIARYNLALNAEYLMISNGIDHFYCSMDFEKKTYTFLEEIPTFGL